MMTANEKLPEAAPDDAAPPLKEVSLILETVLEAPIARVWQALTDPAIVARWLFATDIAPLEGAAFSIDASADLGGRIACTILESRPPHRLSYSWRIASEEGDLTTRVSFDLAEEAPGRVRLKLVHEGFTVAADAEVDRIAEPEIVVLLPPLRSRRLPRRRVRLALGHRAMPLVMRLAA